MIDPTYSDDKTLIYIGDCRQTLLSLPDESVNCVVTSPPYFGLRDYGHPDQMGLEKTVEGYVEGMRSLFSEVRRVLTKDGSLWLNLGDSYTSGGRATRAADGKHAKAREMDFRADTPEGLKPKDLIGIPWRVAFALQADGWYLRQDIVWAKPNPMPESVKDRCTKAHEYIFLLTKSQKYYFDSDAIRNKPSPALIKQVEEGYRGEDTKDFAAGNAQSGSGTKARIIEGARKKVEKVRGHERTHEGFRDKWDGLTKEEQQALGSNRRSVWSVATKPYKGAHFATFPPELIEPCILAGSRVGDVVLDPFGGSGTTGMVAHRHGRLAVLCELNPDYLPLIHDRLASA